MSVSTAGNLGGLIDSLEGINPGAINQVVKETIEGLIAREFSTQTDPDGNGWQAPARDYGHPLLDDTGRLKGSWKVTVDGDSVIMSNSTPYSGYQQFGTRRIPARRMVPVEDLPPSWIEAIDAAVSRYIEEHLK